MKRRDLNAGALTAPIPPAIVTVGRGEEVNALTVAWTGILATVPPKTYISVRPSRHSYALLKRYGEFVINLPSCELARKVDYVGIYTGAKVDKFEKCGFTKIESKTVSAPTIGECPIALECRVSEVLPMGSHDVFIADILSVSAREELIDREGKIHFEKADLLAYAHGEYYALGDRVGRFGFSTDKPSSEKGRKKPPVNEKTRGAEEVTEQKKAQKALQKSEEDEIGAKSEKNRPFYLDLPRSVKRQSTKVRTGKGGRKK